MILPIGGWLQGHIRIVNDSNVTANGDAASAAYSASPAQPCAQFSVFLS